MNQCPTCEGEGVVLYDEPYPGDQSNTVEVSCPDCWDIGDAGAHDDTRVPSPYPYRKRERVSGAVQVAVAGLVAATVIGSVTQWLRHRRADR